MTTIKLTRREPTQVITLSQQRAYQEGYAMARPGQWLPNPYADDTDAAHYWQMGYDTGRAHKEALTKRDE